MSNDRGSKAKTSRKGDARMHNAVQARLRNPDLSLSDALIAGGFLYPSVEDAAVVDAEGVSLAQRKNQLSRRLRMERRQQADSASGQRWSDSNIQSREDRFSRQNAASQSGDSPRAFHRDGESQQRAAKRQLPAKNTVRRNKLAARSLPTRQNRENTGIDEESEGEAFDSPRPGQNKRPRVATMHPHVGSRFLSPLSNNVGMGNMNIMYPGASFQALQLAQRMAGGAMYSWNPSLANPLVTLPSQQRQQQQYSTVAISSLAHSAEVVGLTLDQLAVNLGSNSTILANLLAENLTSSSDPREKKMAMAMRLFESEIHGLYSKVMHLSGFDPRSCQVGSSAYREFVRKAWKTEARRQLSSNHDWNTENLADLSPQEDYEESLIVNKRRRDRHIRHIHRMDGVCGHKAIIHRPSNEHAHIDFVVGDHVECYRGIDPVGISSSAAAWPSRFNCQEAGDHGNCGSEKYKDLLGTGTSSSTGNAGSPRVVSTVIKLSEINLQGPEWNYDITGSIDVGVSSLFRLGTRLSGDE